MCRLQVTDNAPSSLILVNLMMEALHSYEMSVLKRATWRNILEDGFLHSHHRENLKSLYILKFDVIIYFFNMTIFFKVPYLRWT
jgi:hypothetical protein